MRSCFAQNLPKEGSPITTQLKSAPDFRAIFHSVVVYRLHTNQAGSLFHRSKINQFPPVHIEVDYHLACSIRSLNDGPLKLSLLSSTKIALTLYASETQGLVAALMFFALLY